jgi:Helix-turn-helix domain
MRKEAGETDAERLGLEAAARFVGDDLSPHTLRAWAKSGRLPYLKIGRRLFFETSDLRAFVRAGRIERRGR